MGWDRGGPSLTLSAGFLRGVSELKEGCRTPGIDDPVWSFEILLAAERAEGFEVLRL